MMSSTGQCCINTITDRWWSAGKGGGIQLGAAGRTGGGTGIGIRDAQLAGGQAGAGIEG
jgi:hypothetical protein